MANYKADKINGWQRARALRASYEYGQETVVTFDEELLIQAAGQELHTNVGSVSATLTDLAGQSIPLLNPADDSVIGTVDINAVFASVYSIYRFMADRRDSVL
jgi:hypothetical protein